MAECDDGAADGEQPQGGSGESSGTPIPGRVWIVDYLGDGKYCVGQLQPDGTLAILERRELGHFHNMEYSEHYASSYATVFAHPGDTIVFSPSFSLIYALNSPGVLAAILSGVPERVPRRKHFPNPMRHTPDGVGIQKGLLHADHHAVFSSTLAINGFNLGLRGCDCKGTKRRWEWVGPADSSPSDGDGELN